MTDSILLPNLDAHQRLSITIGSLSKRNIKNISIIGNVTVHRSDSTFSGNAPKQKRVMPSCTVCSNKVCDLRTHVHIFRILFCLILLLELQLVFHALNHQERVKKSIFMITPTKEANNRTQ